jgi:hypothetical protein
MGRGRYSNPNMFFTYMLMFMFMWPGDGYGTVWHGMVWHGRAEHDMVIAT